MTESVFNRIKTVTMGRTGDARRRLTVVEASPAPVEDVTWEG